MAAILIPAPADFRFLPTVFSHGWYQLPPFSYDLESRVLTRVHRFRDRRGHPASDQPGRG